MQSCEGLLAKRRHRQPLRSSTRIVLLDVLGLLKLNESTNEKDLQFFCTGEQMALHSSECNIKSMEY